MPFKVTVAISCTAVKLRQADSSVRRDGAMMAARYMAVPEKYLSLPRLVQLTRPLSLIGGFCGKVRVQSAVTGSVRTSCGCSCPVTWSVKTTAIEPLAGSVSRSVVCWSFREIATARWISPLIGSQSSAGRLARKAMEKLCCWA